MSATHLAEKIGLVDRKGDRFVKRYILTGMIAARRVPKKKRIWVFDFNELLETFPSLDPDDIQPE